MSYLENTEEPILCWHLSRRWGFSRKAAVSLALGLASGPDADSVGPLLEDTGHTSSLSKFQGFPHPVDFAGHFL